MASLIAANHNGYHHCYSDLYNCVLYVVNKNKLKNKYYGVTGMIIPTTIPFESIGEFIADKMIQTAMPYDRPNTIKIRHIVISFSRKELTNPAVADEIARRCLEYFAYYQYQAVYGVHEDTDELHIHIAFNPVSVEGIRYRGRHDEFNRMQVFFLNILLEYKINTLVYWPQPKNTA